MKNQTKPAEIDFLDDVTGGGNPMYSIIQKPRPTLMDLSLEDVMRLNVTFELVVEQGYQNLAAEVHYRNASQMGLVREHQPVVHYNKR